VNPEGEPASSDALTQYARMLRASPHNLLSAKALEALETRHFPESMAFAFNLPRVSRLLDIGSGGGLPGIIIAIARTEMDVHLLEATGKKARFLEEVSGALGLRVTVHHGRAEELCEAPLARTFDVVTARAVAPLERLATWCSPYLKAGGQLHAIKGERWESELESAGPSLRTAGLRVVTTPEDDPSMGTGDRPLVVVLERPI
jgi:16S rRNA (guanine527-N7)-methyltransferase